MNDSGKGEAFTALFTANRDSWVRMSQGILKSREEAEDLVQETLAGLWEKRETLQLENPAAYTARAVWLNSLKRRARTRPHISLEEIPELAAPEEEKEFPYGELDPFSLEGAMEDLPETQRTVVRMKYYVGLTFQEIGNALAISLNTAASRCRYALAALRESLGGSRKK